MICKNKRCRRVLAEHYWGEGYCCSDCMHTCMIYGEGEVMADRLTDPTDPTGQRVIADTLDEIDAMLEAAEIDNRLPRIIYFRRRGLSYRAIDKACHCGPMVCYRLLKSVTPSLLHACGLSKI